MVNSRLLVVNYNFFRVFRSLNAVDIIRCIVVVLFNLIKGFYVFVVFVKVLEIKLGFFV